MARPDPSRDKSSRTRLTLLWTQSQPVVMAFIRSMVANQDDAEDVLQQTAYDIATHFDDYDENRPFTAWAIGIAKYKVLAYRRDSGRNREVFNNDALEQIAVAYVEQSKALGENAKALEHCLQKLSEKARTLVELRYTQGLKPASIAEQIGTTSSTVSNALSRTRESLRTCIRRFKNQGAQS